MTLRASAQLEGGDSPDQPCPEWGFDWGKERYEVVADQYISNIAVFGGVLSGIDPAEAVESGLWSASRYVWHAVDVLRFGTERLWTIGAEPSFGFPARDENEVAEVRSYDKLSPVVGLIALISTADSVAHRLARSPTRRRHAAPRIRIHRRFRRGPAQCARGVPSPVGHTTRLGVLTTSSSRLVR